MKIMYKGFETDIDNELVKAINEQQHVNTAHDMLQDFVSDGNDLIKPIEDFTREELEQISRNAETKAFEDCGDLEVEVIEELGYILK